MEPRYAADERTEEERLADESEGVAHMHPPEQPDQATSDAPAPLEPPAWIDWIKGTPEAVEAGRAALGALGAFHDGSSSIRQAVATQQKRWGAIPTGALTAEQWERLHQARAGAAD